MDDTNGRVPNVRGSATLTYAKNGSPGEITQETDLFQEGLPEDFMDAYKEIVGDGLASVTVGADMSIKDFGNGASGTVFVKLTCDQSEQAINRCYALAANLATHYADQARQQAEVKLQQAVTEGRVYFRRPA